MEESGFDLLHQFPILLGSIPGHLPLRVVAKTGSGSISVSAKLRAFAAVSVMTLLLASRWLGGVRIR